MRIGVVFFVLAMAGVSSVRNVAGAPDQSSQIAGPWRLNKDATRAVPRTPAREPGRQGPQVPQGLGGFRGGRGGRGGGGFGDGRSNGGAINEKDQVKVQALMNEVSDPPEHMAILIQNDLFTITEGTGAVRRFPINGKRADVEFGGVTIDTQTAWKDTALSQELKAGAFTLVRTYQMGGKNGAQLIVTMTTAGNTREQQPAATLVYDRE